MQIASLSQIQSNFQVRQPQRRTAPDSPQTSAARPASPAEPVVQQSVSGSFDLSVSYQYSIRMRMEQQTQVNEGRENGQARIEDRFQDERPVSRRQMRRGVRRALKGLGREVGRELNQFVSENRDQLDTETRDAIKGLGKEFRQHLRQAYRDGFRGRRADLGAVSAGVKNAFAKLLTGLEALAPGWSGEPVEGPEPIPVAEMDRSDAPFGSGTVGSGTVGSGSVGSGSVESGGSVSAGGSRASQVRPSTQPVSTPMAGRATYSMAVAVQVSFTASFEFTTDSLEGTGNTLLGRLGNILSEFNEGLATLLEGEEGGELNPAEFLAGLGAVLDKLADELQVLVDEEPEMIEPEPELAEVEPEVAPDPRPAISHYKPVAVGQDEANRLSEWTA